MSFLSLHFAAMVAVLFFFYYILPKRVQPYLLLAGSLYFYYRCSGSLLLVMAATSLTAFLAGWLLYKYRCRENEKSSKKQLLSGKVLCGLSVILLLLPLILLKYSSFLLRFAGNTDGSSIPLQQLASIGLPIGISFYTLQLIAYCVDIYRGKYTPETNFLRFLLFTSFFPQILQGPIPRYEALKETLFAPHDFENKTVTTGFWKILGGVALKLLIADKAGVFVNAVFNTDEVFSGLVYLIAGILYSFQLYADFLSCVLLAQGVALLFGIRLSENFAQPYFASSIQDFWHRWHISLSSWLRDYVYIPLGGSRKGALRTKCNLLITFLVSGIWHGSGFKYLFWGLMHGCYQIAGKLLLPLRDRLFCACHFPDKARAFVKRLTTFLLVMSAWIIFRANSLRDGLYAFYAIVFDFGIEQLFNGELLLFGLNISEFIVLFFSILILLYMNYRAEQQKALLQNILSLNSVKQFLFVLFLLLCIMIFGTYGFGYDANAFIYGGF